MRSVCALMLAGLIVMPACRRRSDPEFAPLPTVAPAPPPVAAAPPPVAPPAPPYPPPFVPAPPPVPPPQPEAAPPELPPIGSVADGAVMMVLRGSGDAGMIREVAPPDPDGLSAAVRAAGTSIQRCLDETPALATGRDVNLRVRYRVLAEGRTTNVEVESDAALPESAQGCVRRVVEAMRVPPPPGGQFDAALPVTYRREPGARPTP